MSGENVDATGAVEANNNILMGQVEGYLSNLVQYDIVTNWATITATAKPIFSEYASRYCATALIAFNFAGFTSRIEGEDMINIHFARMRAIEKLLKEQDVKDFLGV